MVMKNKVDAVVAPEDETLVIGNIKSIRTILPFLVNVQPEERTSLARLSRGKSDFLDTTKVQIQSRPDLAPSYVKVDEFIRDMDLRDTLYRVRAELKSANELLDDTLLVLESEAYQQGRLFYKSVKAAAKEGGEDAKRIADELAYHFRKQGPPRKKDKDGNTEPENKE